MVTSCENWRRLTSIDINWSQLTNVIITSIVIFTSSLTWIDLTRQTWCFLTPLTFYDLLLRFLMFFDVLKKLKKKFLQILSDANWSKLTSIETSIYVRLLNALSPIDVSSRQLTLIKTQKWILTSWWRFVNWCMTLPLLYYWILVVIIVVVEVLIFCSSVKSSRAALFVLSASAYHQQVL